MIIVSELYQIHVTMPVVTEVLDFEIPFSFTSDCRYLQVQVGDRLFYFPMSDTSSEFPRKFPRGIASLCATSEPRQMILVIVDDTFGVHTVALRFVVEDSNPPQFYTRRDLNRLLRRDL